MIIKIDNQRFRIEYEGLDQYDFEDFNLTKIEWFRYDRYIDVSDLIEAFDIDQIERLVNEQIEINNTPYEP
jgi:tetrahydromethanopterin S-methyltransferase subunit A